MVALSFKKQHAPKVEVGTKTQSIRRGKQRIKVGDAIQLYTGQRTKACRKLGDAICTAAIPVRFNPWCFEFIMPDCTIGLSVREREDMARADGFKDWDHFVSFFFPVWWIETDPTNADFVGYLYKWKLTPSKKAPVRASGA
jgi:hypothetical protein